MFSVKQFITLALAGSAVAAPLARRDGDYQGPFGRWHGNQGYVTPTTVDTADASVTTVYVSANGFQPSSSNNQPAAPAASVSTGSSTPASSGSDTGSDTGYMATVNKWRKLGGLPALTQSSKLEANAMKTVKDSNGKMVHELNSGSNAQVLAPGNAGNFENVYVGGWLCEIPSLPGLNGACGSMTKGWDHSDGELDHAKILTSTSYKAIGCALNAGIWACDLGSS